MSVAKLAVGRIGVKRRESGIEAVQRAAIGAQNPVQFAHLQIDMRMILRRGFPDALECFRADANLSHAAVIAKFGIRMAVIWRTDDSQCLNRRHGADRSAMATNGPMNGAAFNVMAMPMAADAHTDAPDMNTDYGCGSCACAQQGQGKNRGDQGFHQKSLSRAARPLPSPLRRGWLSLLW